MFRDLLRQGRQELLRGGCLCLRACRGQRRGLLLDDAVWWWCCVRHHQCRGQLRHCLLRQRLLAERHCSTTRQRAPRLHARRRGLVRHSLLLGHFARPLCRGTAAPHHGRGGRSRPRPPCRGRPPLWKARRRDDGDHALQRHHLYWLGRGLGRLLPRGLRHLPPLHQPQRHRKADLVLVQGCGCDLRSQHGSFGCCLEHHRPQLGLRVPLHGHLDRLGCRASLEHADVEQGERRRRGDRGLGWHGPRPRDLDHRGLSAGR
mmetsp:Transcript_77631/g.169989  ORF Transcript_77631/g.169989 Transcript_77631/m.169989 type:complete len:260 (-) Transcript_77631:98-877(-)